MTLFPNVHPVDELAGLREEIKQLQAREDQLRAALLLPDADLSGKQYQALIQPSTRETVDKNALIAELGKAAVQPFLKTTLIRSVKLVPQKEPLE
jgi:hypothetical protein